MKKEYDFSKAIRGKFYHKTAVLRLPIYLDQKLQDHIEKIARRRKQEFGTTVNGLLAKEVEFLQQFA
jgi:hypothetical protein